MSDWLQYRRSIREPQRSFQELFAPFLKKGSINREAVITRNQGKRGGDLNLSSEG